MRPKQAPSEWRDAIGDKQAFIYEATEGQGEYGQMSYGFQLTVTSGIFFTTSDEFLHAATFLWTVTVRQRLMMR